MENLLQMSMSGDVISIGLNIYLFIALFILAIIWRLFAGGRSRGGGLH